VDPWHELPSPTRLGLKLHLTPTLATPWEFRYGPESGSAELPHLLRGIERGLKDTPELLPQVGGIEPIHDEGLPYVGVGLGKIQTPTQRLLAQLNVFIQESGELDEGVVSNLYSPTVKGGGQAPHSANHLFEFLLVVQHRLVLQQLHDEGKSCGVR